MRVHKLSPASEGGSTVESEREAVFRGEWDDEGVYVYQAFNNEIADYAIEHQQFGGPYFNPTRMTWIKPSFAWVLYRSGYGRKHNQERVLKIKVSHEALASLLSHCECKHGGGGSLGRVQWDPERDLMTAEAGEPRRMLSTRAIQIGLKGRVSAEYVKSVMSIEDVTELSHDVQAAHMSKSTDAMAALVPRLPQERPYMPHCSKEVLVKLGMQPGQTAVAVYKLGKGKAV
eukprot:GFYU01001862.1.p1 GENE.GFYU01001862.1~~GFYU01001862.1.p1  ORF type:complete len:230 (-),score=61.60 GFYU01001862.1:260-949(-)